jgi:hypothetical protein
MKVTRELKTRITKLFKVGKTVDEIMLAVCDDCPCITPTRVNEVVRKHFYEIADELWSRAVRSRRLCELGGMPRNLQAHHLIGRTSLTFRWDLNNGMCLSEEFHSLAHNDQAVFEEKVKYYQPERYDWWMRNRAIESIRKVDDAELLEICEKLRKCVEQKKGEK